MAEAEAAIDRLAGMRVDGFVVGDVLLLRLHALLARARGDTATYAHFRDRYRDKARTLGYEGHSPTGRAPGAVGALDAKWASPIAPARRHNPPGPRQVKRGQVVVCWSDGSLGSMTFVSSRAPGMISMRRGLALAATGRVTVSTPL